MKSAVTLRRPPPPGGYTATLHGSHSQASVLDAQQRRATAQPRLHKKEHRQVVQRAETFRDETNLIYTPIISKKPIEFTPDGYRLQTRVNGRRIRMLIVVTMYSESPDELKRTLRGVCKNMKTFKKREDPNFWESIALCIVSDGRKEANKTTLNYLKDDLGLYDEKLMKRAQEGGALDVKMHLFEVSTQIMFQKKDGGTHAYSDDKLQMMFALKEKNGGKLDSHLWFFNAFADQLNPKYTFLLDVGTEPRSTALHRLYRCMEDNNTVAGVCGEITAMIEKISDYANPVVAAQVFEYKVSHFLDKALESTYGFISVLPGAFSAYRWRAIKEEDGKGPLVEYFKTVTCTPGELGPFKANMFLAEDRILCFELIARKGKAWTLEYVKGAVAETDVPVELVDLLKQRRRWLNGSFFALLYAILNFGRYWEDSRHSLWRKLSIMSQFFYFLVNIMLTWLLVGNYFLAFFYLVNSPHIASFMGDYQSPIAASLCALYLFLTLAQVVCGLTNKPADVAFIYKFSQHFYGFYSYLVLGMSYWFIATYDQSPILGIGPFYLRLASFAAVGSYFVAAFLHGELRPILLTTIQYFYMLPTFVNIFNIYSFANMHDISWGTKGLEEQEALKKMEGAGNRMKQQEGIEKAQIDANKKLTKILKARAVTITTKNEKERAAAEAEFRKFRSFMLIIWLYSNLIFCYLIITQPSSQRYYLPFLFIVASFFLGIRLAGSVIFLLKRNSWNWFVVPFRKCFCKSYYTDANQNAFGPNADRTRLLGEEHREVFVGHDDDYDEDMEEV